MIQVRKYVCTIKKKKQCIQLGVSLIAEDTGLACGRRYPRLLFINHTQLDDFSKAGRKIITQQISEDDAEHTGSLESKALP